METRKFSMFFAVAAVVAISLMASGCTQKGGTTGQGNTIFTVADAAPNMGAISSISITVDSVQVQNATGSWITVSSTPKTYDLLQLKATGASALLANANLSPGTYGQVRMQISNVRVTDSNGVQEAKLPSGDLRIVGGFVVSANSTTAVTFDFLAGQSLHMTGNGQYILAPVVHMQEWQGAQVDDSNQANVRINGGRIGTDRTVGMDEHGNIGVGVGIPADANISMDGGEIIVGGSGNAFVPEQPASGNGQGNTGNSADNGNGQGQGKIYDVAGNESGQGISNTLAACVAISSQPERLSCIAQWCGSSDRDYTQCYRLTDINDQLGCLNKCNPNSNT